VATYTVKAPDGKMVTLQGPDGASQTDILAQAQALYKPQAAPPKSAPRPVAAPNEFLEIQFHPERARREKRTRKSVSMRSTVSTAIPVRSNCGKPPGSHRFRRPMGTSSRCTSIGSAAGPGCRRRYRERLRRASKARRLASLGECSEFLKSSRRLANGFCRARLPATHRTRASAIFFR
jgi:hypothetical protein